MPIQLNQFDRATNNKIIDALNTNFGGDFEFVQMKSGSSPRIYPKDSVTKQKIVTLLQNAGIEFNTFAEKNGKQHSFILRGLNYGGDTATISNIGSTLNSIDIPSTNIIQVARFFTGHMKRNYTDDQVKLYRFTLKAESNITGLSQIKSINGFRVVIEKMRKSTIIQCRRCRFQHTANSCSFQYRCVQCVSNHTPELSTKRK